MHRARVLVLLMLPALAGAEVYKWVDEKGVVHYTDEPPAQGAKPAQLPPVQTYKKGTLPSLDRYESKPPAEAAAAASALRIVAPQADATFREPLAPVAVAVQVSPALAPGQMLVYQVNGAPHGAPTASSSYTINGLERGSHSLSVALVDQSGKELARSAAVTVHMKPPIARKN